MKLALDREYIIAVLYQALPPPIINGIRKDPKPGGYSDSGADIAFCLRSLGCKVVTPVRHPDPSSALDWVFPDTREGISMARDQGATLLWANTVLFVGHPLERVMNLCAIVGQHPHAMQEADDKFATNARLREHGLMVPASILVAPAGRTGVHALQSLTAQKLSDLGLALPLIVKPVRGRGSQGVTLVGTTSKLIDSASALIASGLFGEDLIVEQFLGGTELTVTVLPPLSGDNANAHWTLPPVRRFNHENGVAPYNGAVAVTRNSEALSADAQASLEVVFMLENCIAAASLLNARAPIRIDCRADENGVFRLFDLNMKPNMTGAGRPGREEQDSLSVIAARAMDWSYEDLLLVMLSGAWTER